MYHQPVMLEEAIEALNVIPGGMYIDATLGEGGHSQAILQHSEPGGQLLAFDADPEAIIVATQRLEEDASSFLTVNENFVEMRAIARRYDFVPVNGILFDLGMSSLQLDREARGFSFRRPDPLDMRFTMSGGPTASDIVNDYSEKQLAEIIYRLGEERQSRRITAAIVRNRPIENSMQLADVIAGVKKTAPTDRRIHPATKTFQAIRIAVNDELRNLENALRQALSLVGRSGRIVVISYHSLEDRVVKNFMRREASDCICPPDERVTPLCTCEHEATLSMVLQRPVTPRESEIERNPRSRSAKLRVAERI